jgi:hypothetical protein
MSVHPPSRRVIDDDARLASARFSLVFSSASPLPLLVVASLRCSAIEAASDSQSDDYDWERIDRQAEWGGAELCSTRSRELIYSCSLVLLKSLCIWLAFGSLTSTRPTLGSSLALSTAE